MKKLLAIVWLTVSFAYAQDQSTPNLITSGTNHTWTGVSTGADPGGCCTGGPGPLYDPATNTIHFSYSNTTVAQTFAINQALANVGAGIQITGYNYSWDIKNNAQNGADPLSISVLTWNYNNTIIRRTDTWNYTATHDWTTYSGNVGYVWPGPVSDFGNLTVKMTSYDRGYWAGYYGPKVRNVNIGMTYTADQCATDPLSNTSCAGYAAAYLNLQCTGNVLYSPQCPGYAAAYFTQQCTINALSDPSCPGYAASYLTYQCSINPLYATTCLGYDQAYFNQQCGISPLYSQSCSGYNSAYHNQQCNINPLYAVTCSDYQLAFKSQQCAINALYATDCPGYTVAYFNQQCTNNQLYDKLCPGYSQAYALKNIIQTTPTVNKVAETVEISAVAATNPTISQQTSVSPSAAVVTVPLVPQNTGTSNTGVANAITSNVSTAAVAPPPPPETKAAPTARQELAQKREAQAKAQAVEKGKNLANEMGKAADMESQKQIQNVVIQAMGFTPGFDTYNKVQVPDGNSYKPFTVYNKQTNVDNARLGKQMFGPTEQLHTDLIKMQYDIK